MLNEEVFVETMQFELHINFLFLNEASIRNMTPGFSGGQSGIKWAMLNSYYTRGIPGKRRNISYEILYKNLSYPLPQPFILAPPLTNPNLSHPNK